MFFLPAYTFTMFTGDILENLVAADMISPLGRIRMLVFEDTGPTTDTCLTTRATVRRCLRSLRKGSHTCAHGPPSPLFVVMETFLA